MNIEQEALLRKIILAEAKIRLHDGDLDGAKACYKLLIEILHPMPDIDWSQTAAGRRVAERDAARLDRDGRL